MNKSTDFQQRPARPLSASQRQIWTGQQLDKDAALYNMAMACTIHGPLDPQRFESAWQAVVAEADSLRTRIDTIDDEPCQSVLDEAVPLMMLDYCQQSDPHAVADHWMQQQAFTAIPLSGALVQVALIKLADREWVWFCNQHHIVTDAASFGVLWKRIARHYDEGTAIQCDATTLSTASPSTAQSSGAYAYWQAKSLPPPPGLYGRSTRHMQTFATRETSVLDSARAQALQHLVSQPPVRAFSQHLARFQVLLTVMFAYLYRVSGQSVLTIGTPAPNRPTSESQNALGLLIEMLPLCIEIDTDETFTSLLGKVRREVHAFLQHSVPGACEHVSNRQLSVIVNYVPVSVVDLVGMPVSARWYNCGHVDRHHALRLQATDWNNTGLLSLELDCNDSCFTAAQRTAAICHWRALFDAMVADMSQSIDQVNIADAADAALQPDTSTEHRQTGSLEKKRTGLPQYSQVGSTRPRQSNSFASVVSSVSSVVERFELIAQRFADEPAVSQADTTLSYRDVNARADVIAQALQQQGVTSGSRVALYLPRSLAVPVCLLGILKAGAAYIPIEASNPPERVRFLLKDAAVDLLLSNAALSHALVSAISSSTNESDQTLPSRLLVDDAAHIVTGSGSSTSASLQELSSHPKPDSVTKLDGQSTAYCLYTSGSTGKPKGVLISHASLLNYCSWAIEHYTRDQQLVFPLFTPLSFDLTVTSLFVPLLSGGQIRVYPQQSTQIDNALAIVLADDAVDIIKLTPAHLALLQGLDLRASRVRQLIVGGEDLKSALALKIHQAFGGKIAIHNEYGPTEATVGCIVHTFDPTRDTAESVPIGVPVAGMRAHVLNVKGLPQPPGVAGELYISGPSLAQGYWQQQELTRAHFVPLAEGNGGRMYRTGDLVREDRHKNLVYLGRCDEQIKIRGARVELSEIEAAALTHPEVTACVVTLAQGSGETMPAEEQFCTRCGLSSRYPDASFNPDGVCHLCIAFEQYQHRSNAYFKPMAQLEAMAADIRRNRVHRYDCMMLLSGGKDSTYALARLVDLNLSVLAFTLDNGYLSPEAMANITRVCDALGVDHEFGQTSAMPAIFVDSLQRYANVCNGCFKTIYTLSMKRALDLQVPYIFTGLSRGQFFETRLTEELFTQPDTDIASIDETVLSARKAYHRTRDAVSTLLDTQHFETDKIFDRVRIIDFYRYCPVSLDEMLSYLQTRLPWVRPVDTGRSTNCLINDVGIYVHNRERGYHNYALPYSWDVRLGHKEREAALHELDDDIDESRVQKILDELGYTCRSPDDTIEQRLVLYYSSSESLDPVALQQWMKQLLPGWMLPSWWMPLDTLPLSDNGKVKRSALPLPTATRTLDDVPYIAPASELEVLLAQCWCKHLKLDRVGTHDNFFDLGGDSLQAIRIAADINRQGYHLQTSDLFEHQTIGQLAALQNRRVSDAISSPSDDRNAEATQNRNDFNAATMTSPRNPGTVAKASSAGAFSSLKAGQLDKLSRLLKDK